MDVQAGQAVDAAGFSRDELEFPSVNWKIFLQCLSDFPVMWSVFSESIISTRAR